MPAHDATDHLLGRARFFIRGLIEKVHDRIGQQGGKITPRLSRFLLRRLIVPAEIALRRAILIMASGMTPPPVSVRASGTLPPVLQAGQGDRSGKAPLPRFRMGETPPRQKTDHLPESQLPRITLLDLSLPPARPAPAIRSPEDQAAAICLRMVARLRALERAYENPVREAERWLRRHARKNQPNCPPVRAAHPPLSFFHLPTGRTKHAPDHLALLADLNRAAFTHYLTLADTS